MNVDTMSAPPIAPTEPPTPTMANRRLPCSALYRSFAKDQNWAMIIRLNTPTHKKNVTATSVGYTPIRPTKKKPISVTTKNIVTQLISRMRSSRFANEL